MAQARDASILLHQLDHLCRASIVDPVLIFLLFENIPDRSETLLAWVLLYTIHVRVSHR